MYKKCNREINVNKILINEKMKEKYLIGYTFVCVSRNTRLRVPCISKLGQDGHLLIYESNF